MTVDRESVSQKTTDFSSLVAKVGGSTKVVFLPFQLSSQAQLFAQQLKSQGKSAVVFGSDGTFDSKKFNVSGSYVSFFAPDVTTIAANKAIVAAYNKAYPGGTSPFGAPNYVAAQLYATAATLACKDGKITRTELRQAVAKVKLASHDPRRADVVHRERRRLRREVLHLQDRGREVHDRLVVSRQRGAVALRPHPACSAHAMNWNLFVTELVAGITHGSVYALIALGYSMVYGILKLLNFAHGDIFMIGAFIGYGVLTASGGADRLLDADRRCCSR